MVDWLSCLSCSLAFFCFGSSSGGNTILVIRLTGGRKPIFFFLGSGAGDGGGEGGRGLCER